MAIIFASTQYKIFFSSFIFGKLSCLIQIASAIATQKVFYLQGYFTLFWLIYFNTKSIFLHSFSLSYPSTTNLPRQYLCSVYIKRIHRCLLIVSFCFQFPYLDFGFIKALSLSFATLNLGFLFANDYYAKS